MTAPRQSQYSTKKLNSNLEVEQAQLNVNLEKMQRRAKPSNIDQHLKIDCRGHGNRF